MCLAMRSCASFCHGINRYSFRIIFMRSSQSFQAWAETFSKIRWPSSPGHGGASSPGRSFWNFAQNTMRPLLLVTGGDGGVGPQASAMCGIVAHHSNLGIYCKAETGVRGAQGALHVARVIAAGKD